MFLSSLLTVQWPLIVYTTPSLDYHTDCVQNNPPNASAAPPMASAAPPMASPAPPMASPAPPIASSMMSPAPPNASSMPSPAPPNAFPMASPAPPIASSMSIPSIRPSATSVTNYRSCTFPAISPTFSRSRSRSCAALASSFAFCRHLKQFVSFCIEGHYLQQLVHHKQMTMRTRPSAIAQIGPAQFSQSMPIMTLISSSPWSALAVMAKKAIVLINWSMFS